MAEGAGRHWEEVYGSRDATAVSWYQPVPALSLAWIEEVAPPSSDPRVLDVGGGASTLVDHLLERGYRRVTVLDLAAAALEAARHRLADRAGEVEWVAGDLLDYAPLGPVDLWHDRAVLHFLLGADERARYAAVLRRALPPGGHAVIATFAVGGPTRCSGLETAQYDAARLMELVGEGFTLVREQSELHRTPAGGDQLFAYFLLRRTG